MTDRHHARLWLGMPVVAAGLALSGCMNVPTYGTDKTATEQLAEDVTGILSLAPKRKETIAYNPRPELVKPANTSQLPQPQDSLASRDNPAWPESPEQRLARVRADATANQDNPNYDSPVIADVGGANVGRRPQPLGLSPRFEDAGRVKTVDAKAQSDEFKRRLAHNRQGSPDTRRYLSEPPLTYRAPSPDAPANDLGEDEYKKERRAKAAARKKGDWSWRNLLPGS